MNIFSDSIRVSDLVKGYVNNGASGCVANEGRVILRDFGVAELSLPDDMIDTLIYYVVQMPSVLDVYVYQKDDDTRYVFNGGEALIAICKAVTDGNKDLAKLEIPITVCSGQVNECLEFMNFVNSNKFVHDEKEFKNIVSSTPWWIDARYRLTELFGKYSQYWDDDDPVETAIAWGAQREDVTREEFIEEYENESDAGELVRYCERVFDWVSFVFNTVREDVMRVQPWGDYYNDYGNKIYKPEKVETIIKALYENPDIRDKSGIYEYFFTSDEDVLNLKKFTKTDIQAVLDRQEGKCSCCGQEISLKDAKISMVTGVRDGGRVDISNAVVMCKKCDKAKGDK